MHMRHRMKTLVTAVAAWALALTGTARAGVTETSTAAMADTRAGVLAEILPASCSLELDDDFVLKITLNADIVGTLDLPENLEDLNFVLNGHSITGTAGAYATEGGAAATDGQPAVVVHDGTTVTFTGDGAVIGGKGGDGDPAGAGAPAVADGNGNEIANPSVASGTVTFEKGQHGLIQPVTATSTAAVADTRADVLAEILPASCSYELGDDSVLKVILSADVLGTVNLPENFNNLNFVLNGHSIVGTAGADAAEGAPATAGQPAVVIPEGTFVTFTGDGSVVGGKGGDGEPAGAGAPAVADASGNKIENPSVTPGTSVTFNDGDDGKVDPIPPETIAVTAIAVDDASGLVTIGAKLSFREDHAATYAGFTAWAKENLKVKSSADLLTLDAAAAELPKTLDVTPFTGTVTEMDVTLTVEKKAAQAEFYRLVGIIE